MGVFLVFVSIGIDYTQAHTHLKAGMRPKKATKTKADIDKTAIATLRSVDILVT